MEEKKLDGEALLLQLKNTYDWLEFRFNEIDIEHKKAIFELCKRVPYIPIHLKEILDRIEVDSKSYITYWKVSKPESELLLLLALPREDDEFEYTDKSLLCDASGNEIKL